MVTETLQAPKEGYDPGQMARPANVQVTFPSGSFVELGFHQYDGAGNYPLETYLYTVDGERLLTRTRSTSAGNPVTKEVWTLRDLSGKVLSEYETPTGASGTWSWKKDNVYRDGTLLAADTPEAGNRVRQHFAVDHLGTPRVTMDQTGSVIAAHHYWAHGEEMASSTDVEKMRFTGHERDLLSVSSTADDLDYMHARYYAPLTGRFLSVDPRDRRTALKGLSDWNPYSYTQLNPLNRIDPDGRESYLVARPLKAAPSAVHMFVVTHAAAPGDPKARVRSFGELPNGKMGEVQFSTKGSRSEGTKLTDAAAFVSLQGSSADVSFVKIDAPDDEVAAAASAVMPNKDYGLSVATASVNSNSAALAVAQLASGQAMDVPGGASAPGSENADLVEFDLDGDGVADPVNMPKK